MLLKLNKYTYLILALCILIAAAIIENGLLKQNPETKLIEEFQKTLLENENELETRINKVASLGEKEDYSEDLSEFFNREKTLVRETGFGVLVFKNNELAFWSDRGMLFGYFMIRHWRKNSKHFY